MSRHEKVIETTQTTLRCDNCGDEISSCDAEYLYKFLQEDGWQFVEKKGEQVTVVNSYPEDATHHFCCWSCFEAWKLENDINEENVTDLDDELMNN